MAKRKAAVLIASGDLRESANRNCWLAQEAMEKELTSVFAQLGCGLDRAHEFDAARGHGFIASQKEGLEVFGHIDPSAPLVVAEAVWQYSHHVLPGLLGHEGPILLAANWSGQWPGLVGALNLAGSLTRAGRKYSFIWSENFSSDAAAKRRLGKWLQTGRISYPLGHVTPIGKIRLPGKERALGHKLAEDLERRRAIMGVFDEGCMGMYNAIIPDRLLAPLGVFKERLSQSALYYATTQVSDGEAREVHDWLSARGMRFVLGTDETTELTESQVLTQCRMYIAAMRMADEFGCDLIGIQYQQGLKDLLPASDLAEGLLNNAERPPVRRSSDGTELFAGRPLPHFNEVDECCGLDQLLTGDVQSALGQPLESTLHDVRWGDADRSGTVDDFVWVFEISGSVPPAHLKGGYAGATSERQPPMYFRLGGGTIKGVSKPGEIVWSRIFVEGDDKRLSMDIGRAGVVDLPGEETERRLRATTWQWPIMHAVTYGVGRDQFMARHKANHVNVVYASDAASADTAARVRAAMAESLGITVNFCGTRKGGKKW